MSTTTKKKQNVYKDRKTFVAHCRAENKAFLDANPRRVVIEYVRGSSSENEPAFPFSKNGEGNSNDNTERRVRGKPNAVLVAYKQDDGQLSFGWAASHTGTLDEDGHYIRKPDEFNKVIGLWKGIRRVTGQGRLTARPPRRLVTGYDNALDEYFCCQGVTISDFLERAAQELDAKY